MNHSSKWWHLTVQTTQESLKVGLPPGDPDLHSSQEGPCTYWSRPFLEHATGTAPSLLALTTCVDIGAGAWHSTARCPGFLRRNQTICRLVRASLLWCVARRRSPENLITSISIGSGPEGRTTLTIEGFVYAFVTLKYPGKAIGKCFLQCGRLRTRK